MTHLARKLRLLDYFTLAFGVMVGTAWLVVMDDILKRGGPLGAILGFTARRADSAADRVCLRPTGEGDSRRRRRSCLRGEILSSGG